MKLEIRAINPVDLEQLPEDAEGFLVPLEVDIGEEGKQGDERFHFVAASASGLQYQVAGRDFQILRGYILMEKFDVAIARRAIQNLLDHARSKKNWDEVIEFLSR